MGWGGVGVGSAMVISVVSGEFVLGVEYLVLMDSTCKRRVQPTDQRKSSISRSIMS